MRGWCRRGLWVLIAAAVLGGCATAPEPVHDDPVRLLLEPRSVLLSCNVERSRDIPHRILTRFIDPEDTERFLDRTDTIHLLLGPGQTSSFTLLAEGRYPRKASNLVMKGEEQWQKRREPILWWEHRRSALQIALVPGGYLLVCSGGIENAFDALFGGSPAPLPERVERDMERAAAVVYAPDSGELLKHYAATRQMEVNITAAEGLSASLSPVSGGFSAAGSFQFRDPAAADGFALGFRLLLLARARSEGPEQVRRLMEEVEVSSSDGTVHFSGIQVSAEQAERLADAVLPPAMPEEAEAAGKEEAR